MPAFSPPRRRPWRRASAVGAPLALPAALDGVSERWWRLPPRVRAALVLVLVLLALALVGRGATASPWGPPREVLVAASDLDAGQPLGPDAVDRATWPATLVPDDALAADDLAADLRLTTATTAGTVLTRRHVATGIAGLLDPGRGAVAVPADGLPTVTAGDRVDVVASTPDGTGQSLATDAAVLAVDTGFLWLGVDAARTQAVAAAGTAGRLTLVLRPPRAEGSPRPAG